MVVNRKVSGKTMSMPGGLAVGGISSLVVTLIFAGILAKLLAAETLPENSIGYGAMILLLAASFVGATVSCVKIKRQRMLVCVASAAIYFLTLLAITALFFGGQYSAVWETALLVFCGSMLSLLLGLHDGRGGKHIKRKRHAC